MRLIDFYDYRLLGAWGEQTSGSLKATYETPEALVTAALRSIDLHSYEPKVTMRTDYKPGAYYGFVIANSRKQDKYKVFLDKADFTAEVGTEGHVAYFFELVPDKQKS